MGKRGPKPGTGGRPRKSTIDKITEGNPGKRTITVLSDNVNHRKQDLTPPDYIREIPRAVEFFNNVIDWLKETGCLGYIFPETIGEYALAKYRWWYCAEKNKKGLLAAHPTTGQPMKSPYADLELQYLKTANDLWSGIWEIVKENSTVEFRANNPNEDIMEALLSGDTAKKKK